ncbi:hypothetical protein QBC45DRAFT_33697 [Copromyces sp. CBS 386.78]|nr:hypothetical protein QBC45DRAFT_33697 [Copromyces sp. CBS 386.78]
MRRVIKGVRKRARRAKKVRVTKVKMKVKVRVERSVREATLKSIRVSLMLKYLVLQHSSNSSRKRGRMVDIEVALETRTMLGFAHFKHIGPWEGHTIGPGNKRRRITEWSGAGGL